MNYLRVELRIIVLVHTGEDIVEGKTPTREPDASECVSLVRVAHLGGRIMSRDVAGEVLAGMTANSAPIIAERLRHHLREKGL